MASFEIHATRGDTDNSDENLATSARERSESKIVIQVLTLEYTEAAETFRHAYAMCWQTGSILIASSFVLMGLLIQSRAIASSLTVFPISGLVLWWIGFFEPLNRYADWYSQRAIEIEKKLGDFGVEMRLFSVWDRARREGGAGLPWKPWPWRVRQGVRIGLSILILVLILAMFGIVRVN